MNIETNPMDMTLRNVRLNGFASKEICTACLKVDSSQLDSKKVMELATNIESCSLMAEDLSAPVSTRYKKKPIKLKTEDHMAGVDPISDAREVNALPEIQNVLAVEGLVIGRRAFGDRLVENLGSKVMSMTFNRCFQIGDGCKNPILGRDLSEEIGYISFPPIQQSKIPSLPITPEIYKIPTKETETGQFRHVFFGVV
ncbi:hypothetical protein CAPTEDRAFT_218124 [Capitella teleta]|uniref:Uncharacterized protein n=1 Tax=Capitella teleta TaxID=283909 RepID=R7U6S5_CAPTE|nr:hypothetical protein CAPTEDRAFT_218124 [Capitella teleta]|eukprot:ELU02065.1 hypothetical protein CAPTEDRAFT_218124 [Capitella teleta]